MVHSLVSGICLLHEPPPQAEEGSMHPHGASWAAGEQLLYHHLNHGLQGYLSSGGWITSYPSFSIDFDVCSVVPLAYSHSGLLQPQLHMSSSIFFLLKCIMQKCCCHSWLAQPGPAAGLPWSGLGLTAGEQVGEQASSSFPQGCSPALPVPKPHKPHTSV